MNNFVNIPLGVDRSRDLCKYLCKNLEHAKKARDTQIESDYRRWLDNYAGKPFEAVRTTPFYRASNFVPHLIRMHTDILHARLFGLICSTRPLWKPTMLLSGPHEWLDALSKVLEYQTLYETDLLRALDMTLLRTLKAGTLTLKGPWVKKDYYTLDDSQDIKANFSAKQNSTEGIEFRPIPFDDFFVYPITANNLDEAIIKFQVLRYTREEVQFKADTGLWDRAAVAKLLAGSPAKEKTNSARESQAQDAGLQLTSDVTRPYCAVEAWLEYPLQTGKNFCIAVVFNPQDPSETGLLRKYFNSYPYGIDPFIDFRFFPRDDLYYGYGIPEILEQSQEEQAQIHNARRDSNSMMVPGWKKKRYANVPNPSTEWYPGKVFELEDMGDLEMLAPPNTYNGMIDEEKFLLSLADTYTGVTQPMQAAGSGILSGKRGIYNSGGTLALLAEGNRRLDVYLKRARIPLHKVGNLMYQSLKKFRPDGQEYDAMGPDGKVIKKTFEFTEPEGYRGLFFEIGASDAGANRETERTSLLLMANTMAAYYRQVVEAAGTVMQAPADSPIQSLMLAVLDGAKDLADRLLFAFDVPDRKRLLPDVRALLGGGPQQGAETAESRGMPGTEDPLSVDGLQALSRTLSATGASGGFSPTGNGRPGGQIPPVAG